MSFGRIPTDESLEEVWLKSTVRKHAWRTIGLAAVCAVGIQVALVVVALIIQRNRNFVDGQPGLTKQQSDDQWLTAWSLITIVLVLVNSTLVRSAFKSISIKRARFFENAKFSFLATNSSPTDFDNLWDRNRAYIEVYHALVQEYALMSRRSTHVSLWAGFAGITTIAAVGLTFASHNVLTTTLVTAAGALLTGYVARAMLRNAEESAAEVRRFFTHPLEVERALTAERLIRDLPLDSRVHATMTVVHSLVRVDSTGIVPNKTSAVPVDRE